MRLLLFLLVLIASIQLYSQSVEIKGTVMDENSGEALPFAHLYSPNNFGTIANDSGQFLIRIDSNAINDTMFVQSLGYEKRKIAIAELVAQPNSVLKLKKKSYLLDQVEIRPRDETLKLGPDFNRKKCNNVSTFTHPFQWGIVINVPYQAKLDKVKCRISRLGSPLFKSLFKGDSKFKSMFRVRIYGYDTLTNKPSRELTRNSITTHLKSRRGWVTVDVKSENIYVDNQKVFVAIETVKEGKVVRVHKLHTPKGRSTMKKYDMQLGQCWGGNDEMKYEAYHKNYNNDTWVDLFANEDYKMYPLIKIEVLK